MRARRRPEVGMGPRTRCQRPPSPQRRMGARRMRPLQPQLPTARPQWMRVRMALKPNGKGSEERIRAMGRKKPERAQAQAADASAAAAARGEAADAAMAVDAGGRDEAA